jgi:hypothetical protein
VVRSNRKTLTLNLFVLARIRAPTIRLAARVIKRFTVSRNSSKTESFGEQSHPGLLLDITKGPAIRFILLDYQLGRVLEESIEIHTVELAKYHGGASEVRSASVLQQWAYWIKNSSEHSVEELRELLPGLEFLRATGELNAIREITEEKQMYDAREKASLDIQSNLIDARQEGRKEGIEIGEQRGKLKGSIQIYEGLLGDAVTPDSDLSNLSIEALGAIVAQLKKRLRDRTS